jgi:glycerol-1-phosphatase
MDGTIIDSTAAIVKHWTRYILSTSHNQAHNTHSSSIGKELGVDPEVILATSHGRRSIDVLREYDPSKANMACNSPTAT